MRAKCCMRKAKNGCANLIETFFFLYFSATSLSPCEARTAEFQQMIALIAWHVQSFSGARCCPCPSCPTFWDGLDQSFVC